MTFRKIALLCMLCTGLVAFTGPAMADGYHPRGKHYGMGFRGKALEKMIDSLDLDEAQQEAIDQILDKYEPQTADLKFEVGTAARNMFEVATAEPFNEVALREAYGQFSQIGEELIVLHARMMEEIKTELNDDQKAELKEKITRLKSRMKGRGGFDSGAPDPAGE